MAHTPQALRSSLLAGLSFVRQACVRSPCSAASKNDTTDPCRCLQYEDELAQALALSVMPLEQLQAEAQDQVQLCSELAVPCPDPEAALAEAILHWFKRWFTWVRAGLLLACCCQSRMR